jgi:hypothetical protein
MENTKEEAKQEEEAKDEVVEVPVQVFKEFLAELEKSDIPKDVVSRLNKVILEEGKINHVLIKDAILPDDKLI